MICKIAGRLISAFCLLVGAGAAWGQTCDGGGELNGMSIARVPIDQIEKAFWDCDYIGTMYGVHHTDAGLCSLVTESLKTRRFEGDFERFLAWWKRNKGQEHEAARGRLAMR